MSAMLRILCIVALCLAVGLADARPRFPPAMQAANVAVETTTAATATTTTGTTQASSIGETQAASSANSAYSSGSDPHHATVGSSGTRTPSPSPASSGHLHSSGGSSGDLNQRRR